MKKILLVVNPRSGRARIKYDLLNIITVFSDAGYSVTVYPTKSQGDATEYLKNNKSLKKYDKVVVCGGDGTLNEAVSGVMQNEADIPIGYIPSGTLNEWSSSLHVPKNAVAAAKSITENNIIPLDIGQFGNRNFVYTASFGAFTDASYSAPQDAKNVLGQAAYFFQGIAAIGNIKPVHLIIETDGKKYEGDYLFGAVSNSFSVGGIVKFDKAKVDFNDGLFEVFLIKNPDNIFKLNDIIDGIMKRDLDREYTEFFHTEKLTVKGGKNVNWTLDGEFAEGADEIEIKNLHSAINFIVPKK